MSTTITTDTIATDADTLRRLAGHLRETVLETGEGKARKFTASAGFRELWVDVQGAHDFALDNYWVCRLTIHTTDGRSSGTYMDLRGESARQALCNVHAALIRAASRL